MTYAFTPEMGARFKVDRLHKLVYYMNITMKYTS
jgi:hypothetical protein